MNEVHLQPTTTYTHPDDNKATEPLLELLKPQYRSSFRKHDNQ